MYGINTFIPITGEQLLNFQSYNTDLAAPIYWYDTSETSTVDCGIGFRPETKQYLSNIKVIRNEV